jgi:hypothetical protein
MLNFGAGWGWLVNAMPWQPYPRETALLPVTYIDWNVHRAGMEKRKISFP